MLIKIEFCVISSFRREADINHSSLRNSPEELISQKRGLSIQTCVVETEISVTEKLEFAKRDIQLNKIMVKMEQGDVTVFVYFPSDKYIRIMNELLLLLLPVILITLNC